MTGAPRKLVAVVEDDADIYQLIARALAAFDYDSRHFTRGRDILAEVGALQPVVCVVDLGLPDMSGLDVVRALYDRGFASIVLTVRGDLADKVLGLELGADDYLAKPFEARELVARINRIARRLDRAETARGHVAAFAGWQFDTAAHALTAPDGTAVRLSRAESQLLEILVRAPNRVLTRDYLMEACGSATQAYDRSIDVRISRLRQKLLDDPTNPKLIRTIYGSGYLFASGVAWGTGGR